VKRVLVVFVGRTLVTIRFCIAHAPHLRCKVDEYVVAISTGPFAYIEYFGRRFVRDQRQLPNQKTKHTNRFLYETVNVCDNRADAKANRQTNKSDPTRVIIKNNTSSWTTVKPNKIVLVDCVQTKKKKPPYEYINIIYDI